MASSIEFAKNHTGILDEVYQRAAGLDFFGIIGYDRAIRLFADVMDVGESGVLDCFVEAGAELQRTQVAPEGDDYTFSQIAGTAGVTTKSEDLSEAEAGDILAALRAVTNEMDERQVSYGQPHHLHHARAARVRHSA